MLWYRYTITINTSRSNIQANDIQMIMIMHLEYLMLLAPKIFFESFSKYI